MKTMIDKEIFCKLLDTLLEDIHNRAELNETANVVPHEFLTGYAYGVMVVMAMIEGEFTGLKSDILVKSPVS